MKVRRIDKPWGYELLLICTDRYAGKILCLRAGRRLSLQHHAVKDETLYLLEGEATLELETVSHGLRRHPLTRHHSYRVCAGQRHRLSAVTDARILEISTPEVEDVIRWEDDYGRAPRACVRSGPRASTRPPLWATFRSRSARPLDALWASFRSRSWRLRRTPGSCPRCK